jgi:hypothetical protein
MSHPAASPLPNFCQSVTDSLWILYCYWNFARDMTRWVTRIITFPAVGRCLINPSAVCQCNSCGVAFFFSALSRGWFHEWWVWPACIVTVICSVSYSVVEKSHLCVCLCFIFGITDPVLVKLDIRDDCDFEWYQLIVLLCLVFCRTVMVIWCGDG